VKKKIACRLALALLLHSILEAQGQGQWIGVTDAHVEIYSQAGGEAPERMLLWFERLRTVFVGGGFLPGIAPPADLPVLRVIGFRSAQEYGRFQLRSTADAYYVGDGHRNYIVMPSLQPRHFAMAAHEYAHFALHAVGLTIPSWLGEGLAEYVSTLKFVNSGYEIGGDLPARAQNLRRKNWIPLAELLDFRLESASSKDLDLFYAQSWLFADMLMTSPEYRGRLAEFFTELNSGSSSHEAFAKVYGKSLDVVGQDLAGWFTHKRNPLVVQSQIPKSVTTSPLALSETQSSAMLSDLLVVTGNLERAHRQYAEIALRTPHDPEVHAALGSIAFSKGERTEALREWHQALDDGLKDADLCFRYALAAEDAGAPQAEVKAALLRAIAIRPSFDDARFKLALLESNAGNYQAAVDQLRVMPVPHGPRGFGYWAAFAYALTELGKRDEAVAAAREALNEASTEQDREHARRLAYVATTDLKTQMVHDSEGRTQMTTTRVDVGTTEWNPFVEPSDRIRRSNGQLSEVLCDAGKLIGFRVLTANGPITLDVPDPHLVLIENGPDEYVCGEVQRKAVQIDYAVTESGGGSKNILRGMTFDIDREN
jgi:tetratricopeptide (TPR) repeat protein